MNTKPLIVVSIGAVVLIVLGSLSNVAGYQSTKSTSMIDFSLFKIGTQREINHDRSNVRLQNVIDIIRKMDDTTFKDAHIQRIMPKMILNPFLKINNKNLTESCAHSADFGDFLYLLYYFFIVLIYNIVVFIIDNSTEPS